MSFDIVIKVDTGDAVSATSAVAGGLRATATAATAATTELGKLGQASASVGKAADAVGDLGAESAKSKGGLDALNKAVAALGHETDGLVGVSKKQRDEWEAMLKAGQAAGDRQADVLERIRRPAREYLADMTALDALMKKQTVTAVEYENELNRLNKQYGMMHGPVQQIAKPSSASSSASSAAGGPAEEGAASAALSGLAGGGVIGGLAAAVGGGVFVAAASQISGLVQAMRDFRDVGIEASNTALKFADATHSANLIIDEQIKLAHDLHSNFNATVGIYDSVRDGTDDLNLSHSEQIRLTKTLGETVQLAGKSLEAAGGVATKFSYALASGHIESRNLNAIMREVPEIADLWTKHFGTTKLELVAMVKDGRIAVEELARALVSEGEAVDKVFAGRERTNKQLQEERELNAKILYQRDLARGDKLGEKTSFLTSSPMSGIAEGYLAQDAEKVEEQTKRNTAAFSDWIEQLTKLTGIFEPIGTRYRTFIGDTAAVRAETAKLNEPIEAAKAEIITLGKAFEIGAVSSREFEKRMASLNQTVTGLPDEVRRVTIPITDAKESLLDLQSAMRVGEIGVESYKKRYRELMTTINEGRLPEVIKVWDEFNEPLLAASRRVGALNELFRTGAINAREWSDAINIMSGGKAIDQTDRRQMALFDQAVKSGQIGPRKIGGLDVARTIDLPPTKPDRDDGTRQWIGGEYVPRSVTDDVDVKAARESIDSYKEWATSVALYNEQVARQMAMAGELVAPLVTYEERIKDINGALALNAITDEQASAARQRATSEYDAATEALVRVNGPLGDYNSELLKLDHQLKNNEISASQFDAAILKAKITLLSNTGESDTFMGGLEIEWLKLTDAADKFGATVAGVLVSDVDKLNSAIVSAANGGEVSWGAMVDSMIQDLERLILKQLEIKAINAAIGAFGGGGDDAATSIVVAGASGYATGGSFRVGGSGGPDSQYVPLKLTPGEHVTVQTPQQRSDAGGGGSSSTKIVNVLDPSVVHAAMDTPAGERIVLNIIRRNQGPVRSYSGGR